MSQQAKHSCDSAGVAVSSMNPIPFNLPSITELERRYVAQALDSGHLHGDGPWTKRAELLLREMTGANHVLLTTSCTSALEIAAHLADVGPGDEVIVPSYTFVSTINAFVLRGATPVFADIRPDTMNLDESKLSSLITSKTKAIVPVHYAGVACEMAEMLRIASEHGCTVIEDAAQGVDAFYGDQALGTIGDLGAFSFHATKNHGAGEGGALLVNREQWAARAEVLREKGTNRSQFFRGQVDKYTWVDVGSSWVPSDLLAALLVAQLERRGEILSRRQRVANLYREGLSSLVDQHRVTPLVTPRNCRTNHHMYALLAENLETRTALLSHLRDEGIGAAFHYVPLHTSPMGRRFGGHEGQLPVTEDLGDRLFRLPMHAALSDQQVERVIDSVQRFYSER